MLTVTRLQIFGGPGMRLPADPSIFGLPTLTIEERVANEIFNDPVDDVLRGEINMVTQFAQVEDIGDIILVQMVNQSNGSPMDISNASDLKIVIGYPGGARVTKDAILYTDGIDGKMYYATAEDDLAIAGTYFIQGKVTINSNVTYGSVTEISVLSNIVPTDVPPGPDPHVGTFTSADIVDNIFTITHDKGLDSPYTVSVTIFDNNGRQITPDQIIGAENSVGIDLTSFATISGTWGFVYI